MGDNPRDNIDARFGKGLGEQGLIKLEKRPRYCGLRLRVGKRTYIAAYAHGILPKGQPYMLTYSYVSGQEVKTAAPATGAWPIEVVVPIQIEFIGKIAWFQIGGEAEVLMDGTSNIAAGDFLSVTTGETAFTYEGTSMAKDSKAVAVDAYEDASDALYTAILIDKPCEIT